MNALLKKSIARVSFVVDSYFIYLWYKKLALVGIKS